MNEKESDRTPLLTDIQVLDIGVELPPIPEPTLEEIQRTLSFLYNRPANAKTPPLACFYCELVRREENVATGCPIPLHGDYPKKEGGCSKFKAQAGTNDLLEQQLQVKLRKLIKSAKRSSKTSKKES
jgi:hypothetical protein